MNLESLDLDKAFATHKIFRFTAKVYNSRQTQISRESRDKKQAYRSCRVQAYNDTYTSGSFSSDWRQESKVYIFFNFLQPNN